MLSREFSELSLMFVCDGCLIAIGLLLFGVIFMYVGACLWMPEALVSHICSNNVVCQVNLRSFID